MSIEAMKKVAAEFNRYFTSSNGVDVPPKVGVSRDEWRALFTAIQQAQAKTDEPVAYMWQHDETGRTGFVEADQLAMGWRDANPRLKIVAPCYTRPAPSVPDDVVRDAERYRWLRKWKGQEHEPPFTVQHEFDGTIWGGDLDSAIDAAMLAAQAQKGQP